VIMKWLLRLAFPALGLLLALIYFFGLDDPQTVAPPDQNQPQSQEDIPAFEGLVPTPVPAEGPDIIFKWQDTDGHWHYADQPPPHGNWNTLAIERPSDEPFSTPPADSGDDWQTPYQAPFSLTPDTGSNGS